MGANDGGEEAPPVMMGGNEENIFVSVRVRPLNAKENARNDVSDWECINDNTIIYKNSNLSPPERSMYPTSYTFGKGIHQLHIFVSHFLFFFVIGVL